MINFVFSRVKVKNENVSGSEKEFTRFLVYDIKPVIHVGSNCKECKETITGVIFHCINCVEEYNLCSSCYSVHGKTDKEEKQTHDPSNHVFIKSFFEIKENEKIQDVKQKEIFVESPTVKNDVVYHEKIICDNCETTVHGKRFTCLHCEFDLCQKCERKVKLHRRDHIFMVNPPGKVFRKDLPRIKMNLYKYKFNEKSCHMFENKDDFKNVKIEVRPKVKKKEKKEKLDYIFRNMKEEDLDRVMEIEKNSFTFPYSRDQFFHIVKNSENKKAVFPLIIEIDNRIAGYAVGYRKTEYLTKDYELQRSPVNENDKEEGKLFYAHGMSLAIDVRMRRRGIARILMKEVVKMCKKLECKYLSLNVSVHNVPAQQLYSVYGFQTIKWEDKYFDNISMSGNYEISDKKGDAIKMCLFLDEILERKLKEREKLVREKEEKEVQSTK